jgi:hypothetical protein
MATSATPQPYTLQIDPKTPPRAWTLTSRAQAECRLWVQKGDDRRNAPQRARGGDSGYSHDRNRAARFDPNRPFLSCRQMGHQDHAALSNVLDFQFRGHESGMQQSPLARVDEVIE